MRAAGGDIYGIVSQEQKAADQAKVAWKLDFEQWSDPQVEIARHLNSCGMANIEIDVAAAETLASLHRSAPGGLPGGEYQVGVLQPGIVVVSRGSSDGPAALSWSSVPHTGNLGGALGRPSAQETWNAAQAALRGEGGYDTWCPDSTYGRQLPMPLALFVLALFAHGNFVRPKTFTLDENGQGKPNPQLMRSLGKAGVVLGGSAVLAGYSRSARGPVLGILLAWTAYAWYTSRDLLQSGWKLGKPEPEPQRPVKFVSKKLESKSSL